MEMDAESPRAEPQGVVTRRPSMRTCAPTLAACRPVRADATPNATCDGSGAKHLQTSARYA